VKKILINFAHPAKSRSSINKAMRNAVEDIEGVTINDLYDQYPDFMINVQREQALCESHDVIIFQHPFYWYSSPAIIKEWFDLVLEYGWAYGAKATALHGKLTFQAITTGGDSSTYQPEGANQFTLLELTSPFFATANLCGMQTLPPFAVSGVHRGLSSEQVHNHAEAYRRVIIALRDQKISIAEAVEEPTLNFNINTLIKDS